MDIRFESSLLPFMWSCPSSNLVVDALLLLLTLDERYQNISSNSLTTHCVNTTHIRVRIAYAHASSSTFRFLYRQIEKHRTDKTKTIFQPVPVNNRLVLKPSLKLHLYISTAPCGDGALFTHKLVQ